MISGPARVAAKPSKRCSSPWSAATRRPSSSTGWDADVLRTLRAFSWMRWRVLMNSLERTSARDKVERLSLALEQIGPLIAVALVIPSMVILTGVSIFAGFRLASTPQPIALGALRFLLAAASVLSLIGPLMLPSMERTTAVRLLLLPIPRRTLYIAQ